MSLKRLSGDWYTTKGSYTSPGSMTDRVTFVNPATRDGNGEQVPGTDFATSWAKITALQGRELYKAQEVVQEVTHMVTIFYLSGLQESMTIAFDGRTFVIAAIQDPDERRVEQRLLCVERNQNA